MQFLNGPEHRISHAGHYGVAEGVESVYPIG